MANFEKEKAILQKCKTELAKCQKLFIADGVISEEEASKLKELQDLIKDIEAKLSQNNSVNKGKEELNKILDEMENIIAKNKTVLFAFNQDFDNNNIFIA